VSTEELAELFLTNLYDLAEAAPHPNFLFAVNDFAPRFGIVDRVQLQEALHILGDRGLVILAGFDPLGGISAGITIEGSVFVEKGGETGIIGMYRKDPEAFLSKAESPALPPEEETSPLASAPALGSRRDAQSPYYAGRAIEAILLDIEDVLERDTAVGIELRKDVLSDLATLRIQMARNVKNKAVISAILENLSGIPSIAPLLTALDCIVSAYYN